MSGSDDVWKETSSVTDEELLAADLQAPSQDRIWDATSSLTDQELLAAVIDAENSLPARTDGSPNQTHASTHTLEVRDKMCRLLKSMILYLYT